MEQLKCSVCGGYYYDEVHGFDDSLFKKRICPDCKRAQAMSGGSFGGGGASKGGASNANTKEDIAVAKAQKASAEAEKASAKAEMARIEAEEKRRRDEEYRRKTEAHKQAISEIKEFVFPEDDAEFSRAANKFLDDYLDCNPGLFADGDYKKAYTKRMETELKILKDSNPVHYEKLKELWAEASESMKKKVKVRLIISGAICGVATIGCGIVFACSGENFFAGCGCGLFFGAVIGLLLQQSFKSKTDEE